MILFISGCQKEQSKLVNSMSVNEGLTKPGTIDHQFWTFNGITYTLYKKWGTSAYRPTASSEGQSLDWTKKQIRFFDTLRNFTGTLLSKGTFYASTIAARKGIITTTEWNTISVVCVDFASDGTPIPKSPTGTYKYHETFYYDQPWPAINYRVDVYFNVDSYTGEYTSAMITTGVYGNGIYSDYKPIMNPEPYIELSSDGETIYFTAEGNMYPAVNWFGANWGGPLMWTWQGYITLYYDQAGQGNAHGNCAMSGIEPHVKHQVGTGIGGL